MKIDKFLHEFKINKFVEKEEIESSINENGEEVKTIKKIKVNEPTSFRILKPTRKFFDEAELFHGVKLSEGIKAGLLTRSLLAKRYQNDGGAMSEPEKERYAKLYIELYRLQSDLQRLEVNLDKLSKDEQTKKITNILNEISATRKELQEIENYHSTLFDQTAENRARNQTIMWWVLNISYFSENNKDYSPLFGDGNFEKKMEKYDEIEEKDDLFYKEALSKLAYFVSLWYMGKANTPEDFKNLENLFSQEEVKPQEVTEKSE
jgi:hypothetical protein